MYILQILAEQNGGIGLLQLSQETKLASSTTHRLLSELIKFNLVVQDKASRRYMIGPGLMSIGLSYLRKNNINVIAQRYIHECSSILSETVFLSTLANNQVVCTSTIMVDKERPLQFYMSIGKQMPLHASAAAWAIIAFLDEKQIREILTDWEYTSFSDTSPQNFEEVTQYLAQTRNAGYAVCDGEMDVGVVAISLPIYDNQGQAVASLSAVGPKYRFTSPEYKEKIISTLRRYANDISLGLGCTAKILKR